MASTDAASSPFVVANDPPADSATAGYTMNHFCLLTHDLEPMMQFYNASLGMRQLFTYTASADYRIAYLGYPHGGDDGKGHQTGAEMLANKGGREGLLEIVEARWQKDGFDSSARRPTTFSHVGVNVPDVRQAEERMRATGVNILKAVGVDFSIEKLGSVLNAFGLSADLVKARQALAGAQALHLDQVLLVADPDGNLVEIQQISQ